MTGQPRDTHANGNANGTHAPPELPHITNNIVPLLNVLRFFTQDAYKQLNRLIENLANTRTSESDERRKRKFLDLIITLRRDFVKLYTLVKWAQNAKDVLRLIDLLNWLRSQEFHFDMLAVGLNELNAYSGAKLPNSDIPTSWEVLARGRPQLPLYNYIERPRVSPEKILELVRDLNVILTARMALTTDLPARFHRNYTVKNGLVYFSVPGEFEVAVTVANDLVVDCADDYAKSPFYFIDFAFRFGINPDTGLISHTSKVLTRLPPDSRAKLEVEVNKVLQVSLGGMYDVLHKYAISFKLYLILQQLKDLALNSKWRDIVQYRYSNSLIVVNYWTKHHLLKGWRSFVEVGIDSSYNLNFRWFHNGRYNTGHGIAISTDTEDLSVDYMLSVVVNKHLEMLMARIHAQLCEVAPELCSLLNPYQLLLKLTTKKSTVLAINQLTGFFYFSNPSPIEAQIQHIINSLPGQVKNRNFVTEQDMVNNVVANLVQLRLETFNRVISNKLVTTLWIHNDTIRLGELETAKLYTFVENDRDTTHSKIQFYRCANWPASWFLIYMVSGVLLSTFWWVAKLRSIKGEWKIQWVQKLRSAQDDNLDYAFFKSLGNSCSSLMVDHIVVEDLQARDVEFVKVTNDEALEKLRPPALSQAQNALYDSHIGLYNNGNLLPEHVSSRTILLAVRLFMVKNRTQIHFSMYGLLTKMPAMEEAFARMNVKLHESGHFELLVLEDLSTKAMEENEGGASKALLDQLFSSLSKIKLLINTLQQLKTTDIEVTNNSHNELTFAVDPLIKLLSLQLPTSNDAAMRLTTSPDEHAQLKLLVSLLNAEIGESQQALVGSICYLRELVPILAAARGVRSHLDAASGLLLPNKLRRLNFDTKLRSLNLVQFMYTINSMHQGALKKIQKNHMSFRLSLHSNAFDATPRFLVRLSMRDNVTEQNVRFKSLFELIFKRMHELQKELRGLTRRMLFKLNYDFLVDPEILPQLFVRITECFVAFLKEFAG